MATHSIGQNNWSSWAVSKEVRKVLEKIKEEQRCLNSNEVIIFLLLQANINVAEFSSAKEVKMPKQEEEFEEDEEIEEDQEEEDDFDEEDDEF